MIECWKCGRYGILPSWDGSVICPGCNTTLSLKSKDNDKSPLKKIQCPRCMQIIHTRAFRAQEINCPNCDVVLVIGSNR
jgi:hypothetical protein